MITTLILGVVCCIFSFLNHPISWDNSKSWWDGAITKTIEETLNHYNPIFPFSKNIWLATEFTIFKQGMNGVTLGNDKRLYTLEEFAWSRQSKANYRSNMAFINSVHKKLAAQNIDLTLLLIPSKAHSDDISPSYKNAVYSDFVSWAAQNQMRLCDLSNSLISQSFLSQDTHWTPSGAYQAAQSLQSCLNYAPQRILSISADVTSHKGDLLAYMPLPHISETFQTYTFLQKDTVSEMDLFGETRPAWVLVGTSYSANPLWQFHALLEHSLNTVIQNRAEEGKGPFSAMRFYLSELDNNLFPAPEHVIWEIPERYLTLPTFFDPKETL